MSPTNTGDFLGPLFVVGMPRSGTKLLRGLLLENDRIGIPLVESGFLPNWVNRWDQFGDLSIFSNFEKFYQGVLDFPYFFYMINEGERHDGALIDCRVWFEYCKSYTVAGVFEALMRHDARVDYETNIVWGDKSPGYISHVPLIKKLFPQAKVIHIVRDARDYCLSTKQAWNKNMIRAAQRWADEVTKIQLDIRGFEADYIEIKYEMLLEQPQEELKTLCEFIGVPYQEKMLKLSRPTENLGDSQGQNQIVSGNKEKYLVKMKPATLRKIEAIAGNALAAYGYPLQNQVTSRRLSKLELLWYQMFDALNLVRAKSEEIEGLGFFGALKFHLQHYIASRSKN